MLDVTKPLPEDHCELRVFTAFLLAEVKSQAVLIESKERSCAAGSIRPVDGSK
jgi:transposase